MIFNITKIYELYLMDWVIFFQNCKYQFTHAAEMAGEVDMFCS
jgi:hypothetical protein